MSERGLTTDQVTVVNSPVIHPAMLFDLTFADNIYHVWLGIGSLVVTDPVTLVQTTYLGVGTLGKLSAIEEGVTVEARGINLTLSGIDPSLLAESMGEINLASRAKVYLAFLSSAGQLVDNPICIFSGIMDAPQIDMDTKTASISIDVENKMVDLNRSRGGRLTDQDQRARYPNDNGLKWTSYNTDRNLVWKA